MSWSEKVSKEQEAMKVWEQMRANDDDVEVVGDNAGLDDYNFDADADHDHNDYGGFEGVGGDEGSVARGGHQRLGPLCRDLWKVFQPPFFSPPYRLCIKFF